MIELDTKAMSVTQTKKRIRRCKVHYLHYDFEKLPPHPVIRFGGKYLAEFGFNIGDRIDVSLDQGVITITKVQDTHSADQTNKA
jgi:hypothetical protein